MGWDSFVTEGGIAGWRIGDGPRLVVALHGGAGLTDYMAGVGEELLAAAPAGLTVARYQQRGQAPSSTDGPLTLEQAVADYVDVVRTLGFGRAVVAGHSWGGHLAMHCGFDAQESVEALLVIDPLGAVGDGGFEDLGRNIPARLPAESAAAVARIAASDLPPVEKGTAHLAAIWPGYFADPTAAPPMPEVSFDTAVYQGYLGDALRMLQSGETAERVASVGVPTHFLLGAESPIPPVHGEKSAALIPDATVETVPGTGHFMWMERPGCITDALRALLDRLV